MKHCSSSEDTSAYVSSHEEPYKTKAVLSTNRQSLPSMINFEMLFMYIINRIGPNVLP